MIRTRFALALYAVVIAMVVAGTTAFVNLDKTVSLRIDGSSHQVRTFARTVGDFLRQQGVDVTARDAVAPSADTPLVGGQQVVVNYARPLQLRVEGKDRTVWTTALTVDEALQQLGLRANGEVLTASRSTRIPRTGMTLGVRLPDRITFVVSGKRHTIVTSVMTVGEALKQAGVRFDSNDRVSVPLKAPVVNGDVVVVTRIGYKRVKVSYSFGPGTISRPSSSMYRGESKVLQAGRPGVKVAVYNLHVRNGHIVKRVLVRTTVVRKPVKRVVSYGTKTRPFTAASTSASGLNWSALAYCESGGNPRAVNSAGFYGLYQFSLGTWYGVGGHGNPIDASPSEQTYRAQLLYQRSGSAPWPVCGSMLYT